MKERQTDNDIKVVNKERSYKIQIYHQQQNVKKEIRKERKKERKKENYLVLCSFAPIVFQNKRNSTVALNETFLEKINYDNEIIN